jgi:SOS response regulatory protein OraA/RecX
VIARLREYGYLDDERFAFSYASSKVKQRPIGRRRLQRDLKLKQVDNAVADEALELVYTETPKSSSSTARSKNAFACAAGRRHAPRRRVFSIISCGRGLGLNW